jgi:hypothetical protein
MLEKIVLSFAFFSACMAVYACTNQSQEKAAVLPTVLRIDSSTYVVQVTWAKEPTCLLQYHGNYTPVPCPGDVK